MIFMEKLKFFRQINAFTKELISREFLDRDRFLVWYLRKFTVTLCWQKFRESN